MSGDCGTARPPKGRSPVGRNSELLLAMSGDLQEVEAEAEESAEPAHAGLLLGVFGHELIVQRVDRVFVRRDLRAEIGDPALRVDAVADCDARILGEAASDVDPRRAGRRAALADRLHEALAEPGDLAGALDERALRLEAGVAGRLVIGRGAIVARRHHAERRSRGRAGLQSGKGRGIGQARQDAVAGRRRAGRTAAKGREGRVAHRSTSIVTPVTVKGPGRVCVKVTIASSEKPCRPSTAIGPEKGLERSGRSAGPSKYENGTSYGPSPGVTPRTATWPLASGALVVSTSLALIAI